MTTEMITTTTTPLPYNLSMPTDDRWNKYLGFQQGNWEKQTYTLDFTDEKDKINEMTNNGWKVHKIEGLSKGLVYMKGDIGTSTQDIEMLCWTISIVKAQLSKGNRRSKWFHNIVIATDEDMLGRATLPKDVVFGFLKGFNERKKEPNMVFLHIKRNEEPVNDMD